MSHLKNQVAVVTGGSSGIGLAIATALIAEGMIVAITARNPVRLKKAADKLRAEGGQVIATVADGAQSEQVSRFIAQVKAEVGRIDLLVNNAGIYKQGLIQETSEADWDEMQAVNLKAAFLFTKSVLPMMKTQGGGYVVNISSVAGKNGFANASAYCASKFGMMALTESLLEESISDNIRSTAICPGYVATPMVESAPVPQNDMIPPADIGKLVVGLLKLSPITIIKEIVVNRAGAVGD